MQIQELTKHIHPNRYTVTSMRYRKYPPGLKRKVVETALTCGNWKQLLEPLDIPRKTAECWIRKAQANGDIFVEDQARGGTRCQLKVTNEILQTMIDMIEENCQVTLRGIQEKFIKNSQ